MLQQTHKMQKAAIFLETSLLFECFHIPGLMEASLLAKGLNQN